MFDAGDIFYTKKLKKHPHKGAAEATMKGHGFGVLLGIVKEGDVPPSKNELMQLLIDKCSLFSYDDIVEVFGEEAVTGKLYEHLKKKYVIEQTTQS